MAAPSGGWLQSSPVVPGLGFCLGTRGQMFSLHPEHPNALQGGKRPRTTLTPSLVMKDGKPWMVFGTPGGDQQDQWTLQFFLNVTQFDMGIQEALDAPLFHTEHFPSSFYPRGSCPGRIVLENRIPAQVREQLIRLGCLVQVSAGSITDPPRRKDSRMLKRWVRRGIVHLLGSDGHSPGARPPRMAEAYRRIARWSGAVVADRICSTNGLAVLEGLPLRVPKPL